MINAVVERCAGIDIGKKFLMACVMVGPADGEPKTEIRKFGTTVAELENRRDVRMRQWKAPGRTGNPCSMFWKERLLSFWLMRTR
jgi:hypothetical protein